MALPHRLPSLGHRDFRNFVLGSLISNIGGQVQTWAVIWHLYDLTQSPLAVGVVGIVRVVPLLVLGLFGGFVADQFDRRSVVLVTQVVQAVVALGLAAITALDQTTAVALYVVVGLNAAATAFANPARQAMVPGLVPPEHFPNAASVNGIQWRLSEVLGPMLAGILIGSGGVGGLDGLSLCYYLNAASFVAIMLAVWLIPKRPVDPATRAKNPAEVVEAIKDGFRFIRSTRVLRNAMWIDFWATLLSGANALLPAFAGHVLKLGPEGYGILASASGTGALAASLVLAWTRTIRHQGAWVIAMIALYGAATALFGLSPNLLMAGLWLAVAGAADMVSTVLRITIRQLTTPDSMRGRMSSISMLFHVTGPQLGDFEAGAVAELTSVRFSIVLGGIGSMGVSAWYWIKGTALRGYVHQQPEQPPS